MNETQQRAFTHMMDACRNAADLEKNLKRRNKGLTPWNELTETTRSAINSVSGEALSALEKANQVSIEKIADAARTVA